MLYFIIHVFSPDMVGKPVRCVRDNGTATKEIGTLLIEHFFYIIETSLLENKTLGCALSVIPTALVCVLFDPAVPSLLFYAIFVAFYTCCH